MDMKKILLSLLGAGICWQGAFGDAKADEIMRKALDANQAETMQGRTTMLLKEKSGKKNERVIMMWSKKTPKGTNSFIEFLVPADVKGTKFLTLGNKTGADDQRLWLPDLKKTRKIASDAKDGKFMGSDISYYDMEDREFNDSTYTLVREDTINFTCEKDQQPQKGKKVWVINTLPKDPAAPYSKREVWVGQEDYFVYKAVAFDKKGGLAKTIYLTRVKTFGKVVIPLNTVISSADGHATALTVDEASIKVNQPISDAIFSLQNLEK